MYSFNSPRKCIWVHMSNCKRTCKRAMIIISKPTDMTQPVEAVCKWVIEIFAYVDSLWSHLAFMSFSLMNRCDILELGTASYKLHNSDSMTTIMLEGSLPSDVTLESIVHWRFLRQKEKQKDNPSKNSAGGLCDHDGSCLTQIYDTNIRISKTRGHNYGAL